MIKRTWLLISLLSFVIAGCSGAPELPPVVDRDVVLKGEVVFSGSDPFDRKIELRCPDGKVWELLGKEFSGELSRLDGYFIEVTGTFASDQDDSSSIAVGGYMLVPLNGSVPYRGVIEVEGGAVKLKPSSGGESYLLTGSLSLALTNFEGFSAWVWGKKAGEKDIEISGYEIIGGPR